MGVVTYAYPIWLLVFAVVPNIVLFTAFWGRLKPFWRVYAAAAAGSLAVAIPWDYLAIAQGLWTFPVAAVTGVRFLGIPVEEYLFIVLLTTAISAATVLTWQEWGDGG